MIPFHDHAGAALLVMMERAKWRVASAFCAVFGRYPDGYRPGLEIAKARAFHAGLAEGQRRAGAEIGRNLRALKDAVDTWERFEGQLAGASAEKREDVLNLLMDMTGCGRDIGVKHAMKQALYLADHYATVKGAMR